jgi:type I restriction enzyme M protein
MIASMAPGTGRMAVVLPHGALFRTGAEGKIRSKVLDADLIEAVIGLGPNLFYGTSLSACIMVARRRKPADRKGQVLLVDASDLFLKGRNQNTLEQEHVGTILDCYQRFEEEEGRSHVATLDEIREQGGNLNLAGYIAQPDAIGIPTVEEAARALRSALEEAWAAEDRLNQLLAERGIA